MSSSTEDDQVSAENCRICLKCCRTTKWPISTAQAEVYQQITGFKIQSNDITRICCTVCSNFLDDLIAFRKKSVRVEMKLKVYRVKTMPTQASWEISLVKCISSQTTPQKSGLLKSSPDTYEEDSIEIDDGEEIQLDEDDVTQQFDDGLSATETETKVEEVQIDDSEDNDPSKLLKCEMCEEPFGYETFSREEMKKHLSEFHYKPKKDNETSTNKRKSWMCQLCAKQFRTRSFLEIHQAKNHIEELNLKVFECRLCCQKFGSEKVLHNHVNDRHKERFCPICGKKFTSQKTFYWHHKAKHTNSSENAYVCGICGKSFKLSKYLNQHKQTHDKTGYPCPLCSDQRFSFAAALRSHVTSQHPELTLPPRGTLLKNHDWSQQIKQN